MALAEKAISKIYLELNESFHNDFYIKNLNKSHLEIVYKLHKTVYPDRKDEKQTKAVILSHINCECSFWIVF